jgi:hypothetical protein
VSTLDTGLTDITGLRILEDPSHGNVTVNPDGTLALVMTQSDFVGAQGFRYEATHSDGSTSVHQVNLNVTPGTTDLGWATGESHYVLATDADGRVIAEQGENHETVYVSGSSNALSRADIASREGLSIDQINGEWLANSQYGRSEDLALDSDIGMELWHTLTPYQSETSNHLLFERGYEYSLENGYLPWDANGETEINPILIGAYGDGARPVMNTALGMVGDANSNVVFQSLHFTEGVGILNAENLIFDDIQVTDDEFSVQYSTSITVRDSSFYDIYHTHEEAVIVDNNWGGGNRVQGFYAGEVDGLLFEGNFLDYNGWRDDYQLDGSADGGQVPVMFSHNVYIHETVSDVTMRDTITMRASLNGAQLRSGGFSENNIYLDNNNAGNLGYEGGEYTLWADNLITSAASKDAPFIGIRAGGIDSSAPLISLVDNIITHVDDPNSDEGLWKDSNMGLNVVETYYNDTIVFNWDTETYPGTNQPDLNTDGLDPALLNQTTIQNFTADLLNQDSATIADLAEYLRGQVNGAYDDVVDADVIIDYFQQGFGIATDDRTEAETVRFVPNDLGEGIRWDNRLNWDTQDLPGELNQNDSVDLGGNDVVFGGTARINEVEFGPDGTLNIYGGRLDAEGGLHGNNGGGTLNLEGAGQIFTDGGDGMLDITVQGGRFANTGTLEGADLTATGGQTILATGGAEYDVGASRTLAVFDAAARVGFDGDNGGMAILDMHEGATVAFAAQDGDLGSIEEFRSGAFGDTPNVQSGIDLGGANLSIDLTGLDAAAGTAFTLMDADELVGVFNEAGLNISGLGARDARIVVDYENDSVTLELSAGNGSISVDTIGTQDDVTSGEEALWNALTEGQGVVSDTSAAMMVDEEDDPLEVAA